MLAEILCLRDVGEDVFLERIDHRDGIDFRKELGLVGWLPVDFGGLRRSSGHCDCGFYGLAVNVGGTGS